MHVRHLKILKKEYLVTFLKVVLWGSGWEFLVARYTPERIKTIPTTATGVTSSCRNIVAPTVVARGFR